VRGDDGEVEKEVAGLGIPLVVVVVVVVVAATAAAAAAVVVSTRGGGGGVRPSAMASATS
jgi:hypothetical protein